MLHGCLRSFFRAWREHFSVQLATLVVLTGTFTVVTLFFLLHANLSLLLTRWGESVQLAVFLDDAAGTEQVAKVRQFLEGVDGVARLEYRSKEQAAREFQKQMGHYSPQLLTDPEFGNPLPASFEVHFRRGVASNGKYQILLDTAERVANMAGVEDVSYGQGWVENYASLLRVFTSSSYLLIAVLLSGSLLVVGNAIRTSVGQRRGEIEVLELVGATPWQIRLPYLVEGALMGLVAASLAVAVCFALYRWQHALAAEHLGFWGLAADVGFLSWRDGLSVIGLGIWFGAFGSFLCVRRIATGWAAAERA